MNKVDVDKALATLRASDAQLRAATVPVAPASSALRGSRASPASRATPAFPEPTAASPGRRRDPRPGNPQPGTPGVEDFEPDFYPAETPRSARGS